MTKIIIGYRVETTIDLDLTKCHNYLLAKGWENDGPWMRHGTLYKKGDDRIGLINSDSLVDTNIRMSEFFQELAECECRTIPEVLNDIQNFGA